jgi:YHS domain-containing protein
MLRFFIIRFVLPLILFLIVRSVLKSLWTQAKSPAPRPQDDPSDFRAGGELKQDPVCGTYVAVNASVTKVVNGKPVHFCSTACRDKYRVA